jgi:hypothetical protein
MEMVLLHRTSNKREAKEIVLDMLNKVHLPTPYNALTNIRTNFLAACASV